MITPTELESRRSAALARVRQQLFEPQAAAGLLHPLPAASPLATAAATMALVLAESREMFVLAGSDSRALVLKALQWLAANQNTDGGWGEIAGGPSCRIATTVVRACLQLTGVPAKLGAVESRADAQLGATGGLPWLRRKAFRAHAPLASAAPFAAAAGLLPWRLTPSPTSRRWRRRLAGEPCDAGEVLADAANQLARQRHCPSRRWVKRWIGANPQENLALLGARQSPRGGFLNSIPLTASVVVSLAAAGLSDHPVTRRAVDFLLAELRDSGAWSTTTPLATRRTLLTSAVLEAAAPTSLPSSSTGVYPLLSSAPRSTTLSRLPLWTATDSWGVIECREIAAGMQALVRARRTATPAQRRLIDAALATGGELLLAKQTRRGAWRELCRVWGGRAEQQGSPVVTAAAVSALEAWLQTTAQRPIPLAPRLIQRIENACGEGLHFLQHTQARDGSWSAALQTSSVITTALVASDLKSYPPARDLVAAAQNYLRLGQGPSGDWCGSAYVTSLALRAMPSASLAPPDWLSAGLRYLVVQVSLGGDSLEQLASVALALAEFSPPPAPALAPALRGA